MIYVLIVSEYDTFYLQREELLLQMREWNALFHNVSLGVFGKLLYRARPISHSQGVNKSRALPLSREESCIAGTKGPLCAVCSNEYYYSITANSCLSCVGHSITGSLLSAGLVLVVIIVFMMLDIRCNRRQIYVEAFFRYYWHVVWL